MTVARGRRSNTTARGLGSSHQKLRAEFAPSVATGRMPCWRCGELIAPGAPWDLGHDDVDRTKYRGPEHRACNRATTGRRPAPAAVDGRPVERGGLGEGDERWRVPWLEELLDVPEDATWPRLMTVPHPRAVGSLGEEFAEWADARAPRPLRWWQRLAATRMLEVDDRGQLVWDAVVLSLARQLGKSWLLRELCLWRIGQGDRWGETQDVMHTGKDLPVCVEIQRPARQWAKGQAGYRVREANGSQQIEYLAGLGGRWLVKSRDSPYGFGVSLAVVDEGWNVEAKFVEDGIVPTGVERESAQLLLVSTAHRRATSLMLTRRRAALEHLEDGAGDLLVEWSAPRDAELADRSGWRLASPHWTARRERLISGRLEEVLAGESQDAAELDPAESFRAQWLNQWPLGLAILPGDELLAPGLWARLVDDDTPTDGPLWIAVEDNYGNGAAAAAAARLEDGRIEVAGWLRGDWDSALEVAALLGSVREIRELRVGASMLSRMPPGTVPPPRAAGVRETKPGLALLRDLAANGVLVHGSDTGELDQAVASARVKEGADGLQLMQASAGAHLVRALVWAVAAAHRPAPAAAVF